MLLQEQAGYHGETQASYDSAQHPPVTHIAENEAGMVHESLIGV